MTVYPRYFDFDGTLIKLVLEDDDLKGYDQNGKEFNGIGRVLQSGKELTQMEYEQKLRINRPQEVKSVQPKTWDDALRELK